MDSKQLIYIAGPCVIEDEAKTLAIAQQLKDITGPLGLRFIFKASYDKANRTSLSSYRGPGLDEGLRILGLVKKHVGVPVLSDVHAVHEIEKAAEVLDVIQIPALLSRQTDLLVEAAGTGKTINLKKAQFTAPEDMRYAVDKIVQSGNEDILLTERGTSFGYNNLVVDFRSFSVMGDLGFPVIFDATHSVQVPSKGGRSSGDRSFVPRLARAAAAYGIDGLFTEVHPEPELALCDGPNSIYLDSVPDLLRSVLRVRECQDKD